MGLDHGNPGLKTPGWCVFLGVFVPCPKGQDTGPTGVGQISRFGQVSVWGFCHFRHGPVGHRLNWPGFKNPKTPSRRWGFWGFWALFRGFWGFWFNDDI